MIMNLILLKTRFLGRVQTSKHFEFLSSFQRMCHVTKNTGQESSLKNWVIISAFSSLICYHCGSRLLTTRLCRFLCEKDGIFEALSTTAQGWNIVGWKRKDVRWSLLTGDISTNINRFDLCSKVDSLRMEIYGNIIRKAQWDFLCISITSHRP